MNHSLKFRILSRMVLSISIIFLVLSVSILFVISDILRFSLESRGKDDMQLLAYYISDAQEDAEQASKILAINENVQQFLIREQKESVSDEVTSVRSMMSSIEKSVLLHDYVQSFCIVSNSHRGYWNTSPNSNDFLEWFEEHALGGSSVMDFRGFTDNYTFPVTINSSQPVQLVSYVCPVTSITRDHQLTIGRLIINLNFDQLIYKLKNQSNIFSQIAILNQDRELLYLSSGDESEFMEAASAITSNSQKIGGNYYISQYLPSTGWYLVTAADMSQSIHFLQGSYVVIGIIIMLFIILCILFCLYPLLNKITAQIGGLSSAIDQVRLGNLDTSVQLTGSSELTNISEGFNLMTVSIREHIRTSIEETERSQKLSFELLVAKINPHFIYNTLNSIIYLARKEQCQDIIQMTGAFIYLLQDSIHLGHSPLYARCENEAEVIRQYIIIQKYRYRDRFQFHLEFQPELKGYYIPRNILQPLVENSLIHGICTDDKPGTITLTMKKQQDLMEIVLLDDGVGMDQEYADKLLLASDDTDADRRARVRPIGINNIAGRLNYLFEGRHDFIIKSQAGAGTKITIHIPLVDDPDKNGK
ncbi:sensor histidine kinase [Murimonas intestini]|uniref:Sensor histidine kinase YesM n=2 Tax=Murimonas intestini TaxID=1337051 RepID=A0AB73T1H4_9FIRM|nr:sensor histidine kinase [Murimonas intestini]MCR1840401.1 histidine kinase [Murimonas intestini]MCR1867488.1 histidine kinase [Murimonas intestini]MCR1884675.1 histidine kinase [Murimonas intestini]